jgi:hypothetical protein
MYPDPLDRLSARFVLAMRAALAREVWPCEVKGEPRNAAVAERVTELRAQGLPAREVARRLALPHPKAVRDRLVQARRMGVDVPRACAPGNPAGLVVARAARRAPDDARAAEARRRLDAGELPAAVARALGYANTGNLRRALRRRGMER